MAKKNDYSEFLPSMRKAFIAVKDIGVALKEGCSLADAEQELSELVELLTSVKECISGRIEGTLLYGLGVKLPNEEYAFVAGPTPDIMDLKKNYVSVFTKASDKIGSDQVYILRLNKFTGVSVPVCKWDWKSQTWETIESAKDIDTVGGVKDDFDDWA
mgnify:CR=1 FL=1